MTNSYFVLDYNIVYYKNLLMYPLVYQLLHNPFLAQPMLSKNMEPVEREILRNQ